MKQQDFLRDAMNKLGMTRDEMCRRLSVPRKTFDKWMAPEGTKDYRNMPEIVWSYVRDVLKWEASNNNCNTPNGGI